MQKGKSYLKESGYFFGKVKTLRCILDNAILVTADKVGLYPSILHQASLIALMEAFDKRFSKKIPTDDLTMTKFVLSNNFLKFNSDTF